MTTTAGPLLHAVSGHAAGLPAHALATGSSAAGQIVVATGEDPYTGTLVEVSFDVDDILDLEFSITQVTTTPAAASLSGTSVVNSDTGFSIACADAPTANSFYVFTFTS